VEVEFIEHPAEVSPDVPGAVPARWAERYLGLLAGATFAAATALAALAPFHRLFRIEFSTRGFIELVSSDGWGRTRITLTNGTPDPQHGARYGIVFVVLAAACALLALAALFWTVRSMAVPVPVIAAAVAACGALAAGTAMMWLDAASVLDNARAVPAQQGGGTFAESIRVEAAHGSAVWLAGAAAACAGAGAVLAALHRRLRRSVPVEEPPPAPDLPPVPDHELGEPLAW
jgi:hypothetical protein